MTSGPATTYRYTSDGRLATDLHRDGAAQLRNPLLWVSLVVVGLLLGIGASLATNVASLPHYLGRVLLIGVVWGLGWVVVVLVLIGALVLPLVKVVTRGLGERLFPEGSVTEVELGDDSLVIKRPTRTRSMRYRAIFRVRATGSFLRVERRGRLVAELLPLGMLPDDAIEFIRTRARGAWPVTALGEGNPDRQVVVPVGWAAHVAASYTRAMTRSAGHWTRLGVALLVSALLAVVAGTSWLLVAPVWALLSVTVTYARTRRAIASALPTGSVATTEFLEDRFISRNAGGVREIGFADIRSVDVRGDVVLLRLTARRETLAIARALLPEDQLQHMRRW